MNRTRSTLAAATCAALLSLAGISSSMAQTAPSAAPAPAAAASSGTATAEQGARAHQRDHARKRLTPEQRQQLYQRHAQAFKHKLALTAEQEPAWAALQQALQPGQRHARLDARGADWKQMSTPERIDRMRAVRAQRAAAFDRRADAVKAFYATLRPEQQKTFDAEGMRLLARFGHGARGHHGHHAKHHRGHHADGQPGHQGPRHHHQGPRGAAPAQPAAQPL